MKHNRVVSEDGHSIIAENISKFSVFEKKIWIYVFMVGLKAITQFEGPFFLMC